MNKRALWWQIALLALVNVAALALTKSPGTGDVGIWFNWMREVVAHGLVGGYASIGIDYPPLSLSILAIVPKLAALGFNDFLVFKLTLLVFLLASAACFYWFTRDLLFTAALELSLVLNSVALGYLDIYFAPFLIGALFQLQRERFNSGLLLFSIACFIKWQPLIIAPFVAWYVLTSRKIDIAKRVTPFAISAVGVALPLAIIFRGLIFDALMRAMTRHIFLSGYALNLPWLHTWLLHVFRPNEFDPLQNGAIDFIVTRDPAIVWPHKILFLLSYAVISFFFLRRTPTFRRLVVYAVTAYFAYVIFNTGVHENHLILVCCLTWPLAFFERSELPHALLLSVAANLNMFIFAGLFGSGFPHVIAGVDVTIFLAVANIALFAEYFWRAITLPQSRQAIR